jgi:hypothetical protein
MIKRKKKIDWTSVPAGTTHVHVPLYKISDDYVDPRAFERWVRRDDRVSIYEWNGVEWRRVVEYHGKDLSIQLRVQRPTGV